MPSIISVLMANSLPLSYRLFLYLIPVDVRSTLSGRCHSLKTIKYNKAYTNVIHTEHHFQIFTLNVNRLVNIEVFKFIHFIDHYPSIFFL